MIYFTADLHLGHTGILHMQKRPWDTIDEMNRDLIRNYNTLVRPSDTVYILGDLAHHMTVDAVNDLIGKLHGKKVLIRGNHDKIYDEKMFQEITDFKTISLSGYLIALMHYPMLSWPKSHHGSLMLHGHVHGRREDNERNREAGIRRYDVGVDANDYFPVEVKRIFQFFDLS